MQTVLVVTKLKLGCYRNLTVCVLTSFTDEQMSCLF